MKVVVNRDLCERTALCMGVAPEVFEVGDDGVLVLLDERPTVAHASGQLRHHPTLGRHENNGRRNCDRGWRPPCGCARSKPSPSSGTERSGAWKLHTAMNRLQTSPSTTHQRRLG
jgi:ferredoxin